MQSHPSANQGRDRLPLTYVHLARALGPPIPLLGPQPYDQRLTLDHAYVARQDLQYLIDQAPSCQGEELS